MPRRDRYAHLARTKSRVKGQDIRHRCPSDKFLVEDVLDIGPDVDDFKSVDDPGLKPSWRAYYKALGY